MIVGFETLSAKHERCMIARSCPKPLGVKQQDTRPTKEWSNVGSPNVSKEGDHVRLLCIVKKTSSLFRDSAVQPRVHSSGLLTIARCSDPAHNPDRVLPVLSFSNFHPLELHLNHIGFNLWPLYQFSFLSSISVSLLHIRCLR